MTCFLCYMLGYFVGGFVALRCAFSKDGDAS
jgi:hypothetical protein